MGAKRCQDGAKWESSQRGKFIEKRLISIYRKLSEWVGGEGGAYIGRSHYLSVALNNLYMNSQEPLMTLDEL